MTIDEYIEDCRQRRQGKSFAFFAERHRTGYGLPAQSVLTKIWFWFWPEPAGRGLICAAITAC